MEIYLVRHPAPLVDKDCCYGQSDVPLAAGFESTIDRIKKIIPPQPDKVYSSPLLRCKQVAEQIVASKMVLFDNRLKEMNFGNWEMQAWNAVNQEELNQWMCDFVNIRVPGGENFLDLYERVTHFYKELIRKNHKQVCIITHAGVIRSQLACILEIPLKKAFSLSCNYGSVTKFVVQKEEAYVKLEYLNYV